jgi:hypothetical protein
MQKTSPFQFRDMRRGVIRKSSVSSLLAPENSVSHAINVNFDKILGSAVVRDGTTLLGTTVVMGVTPLGLAEFGTTVCPGVVVFSGASTATIFYMNSSGVLKKSAVTNLNNTAKNRFAVLGNKIFRANGVNAMASSSNGNTWTASTATGCLTTVIPGILLASKNIMLASGVTQYPSRVYFSSVIDPTTTSRITWSENASTGDWIDVMPDDGDSITGFAETSSVSLVFKNRAMYRIDSISKTTDTKNIFNMGAPSQEAITRCQGLVYFFTGQDIRRTDGGFPEQISRLGVQDWLDAIPYANWGQVALGTDGLNVYASIGDITLNIGRDDQESFKNVVLKFSPRDESWSVHSYGQEHRYYAQFTSNGRKLVEADTTGYIQTINSGPTDNSVPIFFDLKTQEIEFGNRGHIKTISDQITVFNDGNCQFGIAENDGNFKYLVSDFTERVNKIDEINFTGHWFTFRWKGESSGTAPIFEGFYLEQITDLGTQ